MRAHYLKSAAVIAVGFVILLLVACGKTAPTHFYLLKPTLDATRTSTATGAGKLSIALSPVKLPEHLNRSQIVTIQDGHQVSVDEFNRWAEPLDASFTMILAENVSLLLGTDKISVLSRVRYSEYDYHLTVNVFRFDGQMGGEATLVCRWSLYGEDEKTALIVKRSNITRPVQGKTYQDLVAALSLALGDLSREIAQQISTYP